MRNDFVKYLPFSDSDMDWGVVCTTSGYSNVKKGDFYPKLNHPDEYLYNWNNGRILLEYQLIYIAKGEGLFESKETGLLKVIEGSVIMLFPGIWHRYSPSLNVGWDEYYVGFRGQIIDEWVKKHLFVSSKPVIQVGINPSIESLYEMIFSYVKDEKAGFQQAVSGNILALLTNAMAASKNMSLGGSVVDEIISKAKSLMAKKLSSEIKIEDLAREINVGYSWFRKTFKEYTGLSPLQYILHLRIQEAKKLLASTNLMMKEIADMLGFESPFYFSRIFKQKCGVTAEEFRRKCRGVDKK